MEADMRVLIGSLAGALFLAPCLGAQAKPQPTAQPQAQAGTVAGIAPAPATRDTGRSQRGDRGDRGDRDNRWDRGRRSPTVTVLSDGRVFADFGRGYEQVVSRCGVAATSVGVPAAPAATTTSGNVQPTVAQPSVVQPPVTVSQPVPYTPPVPAQQTASQQMAQPQQSSPAASSCWATDTRGQIFIIQP
jgi:hypothetical protein